MEENETIDKLCSTVGYLLAEAGKEAGFSVWPAPRFSPIEGEMYVSPYLLPSLLDDLSKLEQKGYNKEKVAELFKNPSRITQFVWTFHTLKDIDLSENERVKLVKKIIDLISISRKDPFCEEGKNIIWSEEKVNLSLEELNWIDLDEVSEVEEYRETLGRLNGTLWLLCELLYFDFHGAGHEFHGPYNLVKDNQMLIVREYYDLKPDYFSFTDDLPFNRLMTFEIYPKKDVTFDFFNRSRFSVPLSKYLQKLHIEINGKGIGDFSEINNALNSSEKVSERGSKRVGKLERKELLEKFGEAYFFTIKPIQEKLGEDWRPPESFYHDIEKGAKEGKIKEALDAFEKTYSLPKQEFIKAIAQLFDPRGD